MSVFFRLLEITISKPLLTQVPVNQTVFIGDRIELSVRVVSHPEYALQWLKHDSEDPSKAVVVQVFQIRMHGSKIL